MKKILLTLMTIAAFTTVAMSQAVNVPGTNGLVIDTVVNTATETFTLKVKETGSLSAVVLVTKISGTVGGTLTFQASNDGVNYADVVAPFTVGDSTQTKLFDVDKIKYLYYRIKFTGTGTMSASARVSMLAKK